MNRHELIKKGEDDNDMFVKLEHDVSNHYLENYLDSQMDHNNHTHFERSETNNSLN